jgi:phage gp16-like protein
MTELNLGGTSASPAHFGGRRRSHKLRLVKKKTVRRMLAKKGLKMRGGGEPDTAAEAGVVAGGRRKGHKKTHRKRRGLFHF